MAETEPTVVMLGVVLPKKVDHEYLEFGAEHLAVPIEVHIDGERVGTVTLGLYSGRAEDVPVTVQHTWEPRRGCSRCEEGCVLCDKDTTVEELRDKLREAYDRAEE